MCADGKCLRGSKMTQCVLCPFAWPHPRHLSCLWELLLLVSKVDFFFLHLQHRQPLISTEVFWLVVDVFLVFRSL